MKEPKLIFDKEKVVAFLKTDADGHSIFDPELFTKELGFEKEKLKSLVKTHQSDPESYKETIVKDGERVEETQGIYCLDFLYWFAKKIGIKYRKFFQRTRISGAIFNYKYSFSFTKSMKLTKAQRLAAYIKVRDHLLSSGSYADECEQAFLCCELRDVILDATTISLNGQEIFRLFPEFELFHPKDNYGGAVWFHHEGSATERSVQNPNGCRLFVIQMCIEMMKV